MIKSDEYWKWLELGAEVKREYLCVKIKVMLFNPFSESIISCFSDSFHRLLPMRDATNVQ